MLIVLPARSHVSVLAQEKLGRPVSPHVFGMDSYAPHYAFPLVALTSVTNRATGVVLTVGKLAFPRLLSAFL